MATGMDIFEFGMHYQSFVRKHADDDWSVAIFNLFQILEDDQWFHFCNHVHAELKKMNVPTHKDKYKIRDLTARNHWGDKPKMIETDRLGVYCRALELALGRYDAQSYLYEKYDYNRDNLPPDLIRHTQLMLGALAKSMPREDLEGFVNILTDKEFNGPWASHFHKKEEEA